MHFAEHFALNTVSRLLCRPPNNRFERRPIAFSPCMMDVRKGNFCVSAPETNELPGARLCKWKANSIKCRFRFQSLPKQMRRSRAQQAAEEKMMLILGAVFMLPGYHNAKPPATSIIGPLNSNLTLSYEQALLDMETIAQVNRYLKGIRVDKEALALDAIREVGPGAHSSTLSIRCTTVRTNSGSQNTISAGPGDGTEVVAGVSPGKGGLEYSGKKGKSALINLFPFIIPLRKP